MLRFWVILYSVNLTDWRQLSFVKKGSKEGEGGGVISSDTQWTNLPAMSMCTLRLKLWSILSEDH